MWPRCLLRSNPDIIRIAICQSKSALLASVKTLEQTLLTAGASLRRETLPVKEELADRVRRELRRNAVDHCFINTAELDEIWPDRVARRSDLYQVAEKNGFALAWYDEHIGAIFTNPRFRAAAPVRRVRAERDGWGANLHSTGDAAERTERQ